MDWKVKVMTRTGYVKDVKVYDYINPQDAVKAALSQTDSTQFITVEHIPDETYSSTYSQSNVEYSRPGSWGSQYNELDKLQLTLLMLGMIVFAVFPPISILLAIVFVVKVITANLRNK